MQVRGREAATCEPCNGTANGMTLRHSRRVGRSSLPCLQVQFLSSRSGPLRLRRLRGHPLPNDLPRNHSPHDLCPDLFVFSLCPHRRHTRRWAPPPPRSLTTTTEFHIHCNVLLLLHSSHTLDAEGRQLGTSLLDYLLSTYVRILAVYLRGDTVSTTFRS